MQINRLFGIVHILLNQKSTTANQLASHFEVSKRTILRDINTLSAVGIPIYTSQGKGGGIAILDNYVLNKIAISDLEQQQILSALQGFQSLSHDDNNQLLPKLSAMFGKTQTHWIDVDFSNWGYCDQQPAKFDSLKNAILTQQKLAFDYANSQGEISHRIVLPLRLLFKSQGWYLQAYCQTKLSYRFFKINRIHELKPLAEGFDRLAFTPPDIEDIPVTQSHLIQVTMKFLPALAYRVYDEFLPQWIVKNHDGSLTVTIEMVDGDWLYQYLLSFGIDMEVLAPPAVRAILKQQLQQMEKLYL